MSKLESNQREIVGSDGVKRIYSFRVLTKREAMKADWLVKGVALGLDEFSESTFEKTLLPAAKLMLNGCTIATENDGPVYVVDDVENGDYPFGMDDMLQAILTAADILGFIKPAKAPAGSDAKAAAQTTSTASNGASPTKP